MDLPIIEDMFEMDDNSDNDEELHWNSRDIWKTFPQEKRWKSLKSLRNLAIDSICRNISYWMSYLPENAFRCLYVISPFDNIRTVDTIDIMKKLIQTRTFHPKHLNLILHQNLTDMDFDWLSRFNLTDIHLKTLLNRCKKIKRLKIPHDANFNSTTLNKIPIIYPRLDELVMYSYHLDRAFLKATADNCSELKSLHLSSAYMFDSKLSETLKFCKSLKSLSLNKLENATAEATWRFLSRHPQLKNISLHQSTMRFSSLNGADYQLPNISGLDLSASTISDRGVAVLVTTMNNVAYLDLSNCIFLTSIAFQHIEKFKHLVSLRMSYLSHHCEFDSNVERCLMRVGGDLTLLDLSGFRSIKTSVIGSCCPNLSRLYLNDCLISSLDWIPNLGADTEPFLSLTAACPKLTHFQMGNVNMSLHEDFSESLKKMFGGTNYLQHFRLSSESLSAQVYEAIFKSFEWNSLTTLNLSGNRHCLTLKNVVIAIQNTPKLSTLDIRNCNLISQEKKEIKRMLQLSNVFVDLKF